MGRTDKTVDGFDGDLEDEVKSSQVTRGLGQHWMDMDTVVCWAWSACSSPWCERAASSWRQLAEHRWGSSLKW